MDLGLKGKHALITGGSHGIGLACATSLAEEGCHVAICARGQDRITSAVSDLKSFGVKALGVSADVLVSSDIEKVTKEIEDAWGRIDILINNVGGGGRWGSSVIEETSEEVWVEVYGKNAMAAIRFTVWAIPLMRKQKWGRVITIASRHGYEGGGRPWFNMAKSAQISMMKTMGMTNYLVRDGITFNTVCPGGIMIPDTGWEREMEEDPEGQKKKLDLEFPLGRLGTPEEVASVVAFFCSEKASLVNGASVTVDGSESRSF